MGSTNGEISISIDFSTSSSIISFQYANWVELPLNLIGLPSYPDPLSSNSDLSGPSTSNYFCSSS